MSENPMPQPTAQSLGGATAYPPPLATAPQQPPYAVDPYAGRSASSAGAPGQAPGQPGPYAGQPVPYAVAQMQPVNQAMLPHLRPVGFGRRAKGYLLDHGPSLLFTLGGLIPLIIGEIQLILSASTIDGQNTQAMTSAMAWIMGGMALTMIGSVISLIMTIAGRWIGGGKTGQSWGRRWANTRLVDERTGLPIGIGMTIVRDFAHYLDGLSYVGWLWPLWHEKRQTFADMMMHTVVVDADECPLPPGYTGN